MHTPTAPRRIPIVPRVKLPDVPDAVRALLDTAREKAATDTALREVRRARALESLVRTGKHIYTGTVPAAVKARRRKAGKAAHLARKASWA